MQQVSLSLLSRDCSIIQMQKIPMILTFIWRGRFLQLLQPSTRQGMHLSAFLEDSTLRRVLNCFLPWRQVSPVDAFQYSRAFRRTRMVHRWETCRESWRYIHCSGFWFCHNPVFFFLFLHPLRHRFGTANESEILIAAKSAEMADVEHMKKIVVQLPLVSMSASWCLVSMYLVSILGSTLILSNNQSRATLWVLDTCLIVGLLPLIIILIKASLFSKTCSTAPNREDLTLDETWSTLFRSRLTCLVWFWFHMWSVVLSDRFPCDSGPLDLLIWIGGEWNT